MHAPRGGRHNQKPAPNPDPGTSTLAKDLLNALQDIIHFAHAVYAAELALFFVVVYQGLCLRFISFKPGLYGDFVVI